MGELYIAIDREQVERREVFTVAAHTVDNRAVGRRFECATKESAIQFAERLGKKLGAPVEVFA